MGSPPIAIFSSNLVRLFFRGLQRISSARIALPTNPLAVNPVEKSCSSWDSLLFVRPSGLWPQFIRGIGKRGSWKTFARRLFAAIGLAHRLHGTLRRNTRHFLRAVVTCLVNCVALRRMLQPTRAGTARFLSVVAVIFGWEGTTRTGRSACRTIFFCDAADQHAFEPRASMQWTPNRWTLETPCKSGTHNLKRCRVAAP